MGVSYNSVINRDGLVLHLVAGNSRSYPGTGTTWYDLSGRNNHGTLVSGPTYSSANSGIISLDGTDDWVQVLPSSTFSSISNITMSGWLYIKFESGAIFPGRFGFSTNTFDDFRFFFGRQNTGITNFYCVPASGARSVIQYTLATGVWLHITMVADGLNFLLYINGVLVQQISKLAGLNLSGAGYAIGQQYNRNSGQFGNINVDDMRVYNRALPSLEIRQIFNSTRRRFGV